MFRRHFFSGTNPCGRWNAAARAAAVGSTGTSSLALLRRVSFLTSSVSSSSSSSSFTGFTTTAPSPSSACAIAPLNCAAMAFTTSPPPGTPPTYDPPADVESPDAVLGIPLLIAVDAKTEVHIDNTESVDELNEVLKSKDYGHRLFVRAAPSIGKSTLARDYVEKHADSVYITMADQIDPSTEVVVDVINDAIKKKWTVPPNQQPVQWAFAKENKKTLVIDEAHVVFRHRTITSALTKADGARVIFVSAASEVRDSDTNAVVSTPLGVTSVFWFPPPPNLVNLAKQLQRANVFLDVKSVEFMWLLCAGHRGIFMAAMRWVQIMQQPLSEEQRLSKAQQLSKTVQRSGAKKLLEVNEPSQAWNIDRTVWTVRRHFGDESPDDDNTFYGTFWTAIKQSRAVRVNGRYSENLANVPPDFLPVLCGGPSRISSDDIRRELVVHGFVKKVVRNTTAMFQLSGIGDVKAQFEPSNAVLARYYRVRLEKEFALEVKRELPSLSSPPLAETIGIVCASLIAHVLPYMWFSDVRDMTLTADGELTAALAKTGLPREIKYSDAMLKIIQRFFYPHAVAASNTEKDVGQPDIVIPSDPALSIDDTVIEVVMHTKLSDLEVYKHAVRFHTHKAYKGTTFRAVVIIGKLPLLPDGKSTVTADTLQDAMRDARNALDANNLRGIEIIGVLVSAAHDAYTMYVIPSNSVEGTISDALAIPVDGVSRKLVWNQNATGAAAVTAGTAAKTHQRGIVVESAQRYVSSKLDPDKTVRVQQVDDRGKSVGRAFHVVPTTKNIESLADAIKAKLEANRGGRVDALAMIIKSHDGKDTFEDPDTPLVRGTEYTFELPKLKE